MAELVRCPFCGGKASETDDPIVFGCSSCDVWEVDPEDWNMRSLDAALDVVIAAVQKDGSTDGSSIMLRSRLNKNEPDYSRYGANAYATELLIAMLEALKATPTQPGEGQ